MRLPAARGLPATVAESVELLDMAERELRLLGDPGAQADVHRAVRERLEGAKG